MVGGYLEKKLRNVDSERYLRLMFHQLYGGTSSVPDWDVVGAGTKDDGCTDTGWRYCGDTCIEYETKYRDEAHFFAILNVTSLT